MPDYHAIRSIEQEIEQAEHAEAHDENIERMLDILANADDTTPEGAAAIRAATEWLNARRA